MPTDAFRKYGLSEHRHRFAAWAAGRAVARNFASASVVFRAFRAADVRGFVERELPGITLQADFDGTHRRLCRGMLESFRESGSEAKDPSYGFAAKALAVYLKASVGMCAGEMARGAAYMHPPVDRELLLGLRRYERKALGRKSGKCVFPLVTAVAKWTQFDEDGYYEVIRKIRGLIGEGVPLWRVEALWDLDGGASQ